MAKTTIKAEDYMFARDYHNTGRLTGQHNIFQYRNNSFLHPTIESHLASQPPSTPLAIADIACGNGIWTFEAARRYPHAQISAYDITATQFPPEWVRPGNVEFGVLDLFATEMPSELDGRFDVVHIRLVRGVVPGINSVMMERSFGLILKMLKPNGYLHWEEAVYPYFKVHSPTSPNPLLSLYPNTMPTYAQHLDISLGNFMSKWRDWDWAAAMREAGYLDVVDEEVPVRLEMMFYEHSYMQWTLQDFIDVARKRVGETKGELLDQAQSEVERFAKEGCLHSLHMKRYLGRKGE